MNEEQFKAIRIQKGFTQEEFGRLLDVSRSTIEAIENKRRPISDTVRIRLSQEVDMSEMIPFFERYKNFKQIGSL